LVEVFLTVNGENTAPYYTSYLSNFELEESEMSIYWLPEIQDDEEDIVTETILVDGSEYLPSFMVHT